MNELDDLISRLLGGRPPLDPIILSRVARRIDMGKRIEESELDLTAAILARTALASDSSNSAVALRLANTAYKAIERSSSVLLAKLAAEGGPLDQLLDRCVANTIKIKPDPPLIISGALGRRTIPMTVLFSEGPIARAYLSLMFSAGLRPEKIVHLVDTRDRVTRKPHMPWLPAAVRMRYSAWAERQQIHFWPRNLMQRNESLSRSMVDAMISTTVPLEVMSEAHALAPLEKYSENVVRVPFSGWAEPSLLESLQAHATTLYLFTGGGLVPARTLECLPAPMLHVHPGWLPDIRGADGALWSVLLTGQFSATCFFLTPGIDEGDIVARRWVEPISFSLPASEKIEQKKIYRAFYSFVDPWLRASLLVDTLCAYPLPSTLPRRTQSVEEGTQYFFMHQRLQARAFRQLT